MVPGKTMGMVIFRLGKGNMTIIQAVGIKTCNLTIVCGYIIWAACWVRVFMRVVVAVMMIALIVVVVLMVIVDF